MQQFSLPLSTHATILETEAEVMHKICIMLHQEQMETTECGLHAAAKVELILRYQRHIESLRREQKALHRDAERLCPTVQR